MNRYLRYLPYNLTHLQPDGSGNKLYFKFDTATGKLVSQREQFCFCTSTYWHYLENLSYQPHAKLGGMQKFLQGHFFDQMTDHDYSHMQHAKG